MTENEVIARFKSCQENVGRCEKCRFYSCCGIYDMEDAAIEALEEVQQYRQIGTVDECREAMEKQTSKVPDYEGDGYSNGQLVYDTWVCPCCGHHYEVDYDDYEYCPKCGQHIDWRNENEEID